MAMKLRLTVEDQEDKKLKEVPLGPELLRVMQLPRREIPDLGGPEAQQLADWITEKFRLVPVDQLVPGPLLPVQAVAIREAWDTKGLFGQIGVGRGKAEPHSEPVLLARGWTPMGEVRVGDAVYGSDGQLHAITHVHPQGVRPIYKLTFSDGSTVRCDIDHLWTLETAGHSKRVTHSVRELLGMRLFRTSAGQRAWKYKLPMVKPIVRANAQLPLDPYTLGLLLGDGSMVQGSPTFCSADGLESVLVLPEGVSLSYAAPSGALQTVRLTGSGAGRPNPLTEVLKGLCLWGHDAHSKFVPPQYMQGSIQQRLDMLAGLFDTDGSVKDDGSIDFCVASPQLRDDTAELVESLGGTAVKSLKTLNTGDYAGNTYYRVVCKLPWHLPPLRLARKLEKFNEASQQRPPHRMLVSIEEDGHEEASCISVSAPDHLYVTRHHILTHNSITAWMIAGLFNLERMMYVCMGNGTDDAELKFAEYRKCWKGPRERQLPVFSYELLSNPSSAEELDEHGNVVRLSRLARLRPQLIILDEAQCCTNGAGYMYMKQYLRDNPDTIVIVLTGTPYKTSIKDAATLMEWSLKERSPLPRGEFFQEREAWAGFLDAKEAIFGRTELGAFTHLAEMYGHKGLRIWDKDNEEEVEALRTTVRRVVAQRILETPGVIGTQDPPLNVRLTIEPWYPLCEDHELTVKYVTMRTTQQTPDGMEFASPMDGARHEATLGLGFWQKLEPTPPKEWRDARNAWNKACRKKLQKNNRRIHSEAKLKAAVKKGLFPDLTPLLNAWEREEREERERTGLREPPTVCVFESEEVVDSVRDWVRKYGGLVWVGHIGLGEKLSEALGIPYYGAGGGWDEKRKLNIRDHKGGPAIASVDACSTGKNLQGFWNANLWLCPPGEQGMARTHRLGQKADVVTNHVYLGCARHLDSFERAKEVKARFQADLLLAPLKLIYAENTMPTAQELVDEMGESVRWASKALDEVDDF